MKQIPVSAYTRRPPPPQPLRCPHCNRWCKGRSGLAKHAIRKHQVKS